MSGPASGENRVVQDEGDLLRSAGHEVLAWTPTPDTSTSREAATRAIWSRPAIVRLHGLVRSWRPDVVHVHNLFPMLSPAVLRDTRKLGVGVVMTLHNYR